MLSVDDITDFALASHKDHQRLRSELCHGHWEVRETIRKPRFKPTIVGYGRHGEVGRHSPLKEGRLVIMFQNGSADGGSSFA